MLRLLRGPTGRTTMVVTLHQPDLARRHCTRVIGLRGGQIVLDDGSHVVVEPTR